MDRHSINSAWNDAGMRDILIYVRGETIDGQSKRIPVYISLQIYADLLLYAENIGFNLVRNVGYGLNYRIYPITNNPYRNMVSREIIAKSEYELFECLLKLIAIIEYDKQRIARNELY